MNVNHFFTLAVTTCLSIGYLTACTNTPSILADGEFASEAVVENEWIFSEKDNLHFILESSADTTVDMSVYFVTDRSLMGERDTVYSRTRSIRLDGGKSKTVACRFSLEPGFYQVCADFGDSLIAPFNIGVSPENVVSETTRKEDFDEFWANNLAELAAVPMDAELTLLPEYSTEKRNVYRVEMTSIDGGRMGGILAEPVAEGTYTTYVEYMGYGADPYYYNGNDNPEAIQFLVSVRGQGIFKNPGDGRWIDQGLESKENFYYKGAFCDLVRAVDFVCSRPGCDQSRLFAHGESQGGAFTWIAASLDHRFTAIAPAVPFLSDYEDYYKIVWWPMWEVMGTADAEGLAREDVYDMLTYFDVMNFTDKIECPVLMGFGLQDPTCPPHTNFAGYNQVRSKKDYICYHNCGHGIWQINEWAEARKEFFETISR